MVCVHLECAIHKLLRRREVQFVQTLLSPGQEVGHGVGGDDADGGINGIIGGITRREEAWTQEKRFAYGNKVKGTSGKSLKHEKIVSEKVDFVAFLHQKKVGGEY